MLRLDDSPEEDQQLPQIQESQSLEAREAEGELGGEEGREQQNIFQAIQRYIEQHCCIKFLLFLIIILLVVAVFQQKGYLIKKQRTFRFFIEKIQKERIRKELISDAQDRTGQNYDKPPQLLSLTPIQPSQQSKVLGNGNKADGNGEIRTPPNVETAQQKAILANNG